MAIHFDKITKTFYLEGKNLTYAFFINNYGYAEHLYFGKRIHRDCIFYTRSAGTRSCRATIPGRDDSGIMSYNIMSPEITFFGTGDYREATVHPEFTGGDRLTELLYVSHEILPKKPKIN